MMVVAMVGSDVMSPVMRMTAESANERMIRMMTAVVRSLTVIRETCCIPVAPTAGVPSSGVSSCEELGSARVWTVVSV